METDFLCEQRLKKDSPKLHGLFRDSVFSLQRLLSRYKTLFPTYTDHTVLHSMEVLNFCNTLIGGDNIEKLNADEIYILMMSCYLHDSGMGISASDYKEFSKKIDFGNYVQMHPDFSTPDLIRDFHHEFSGEYIKKYAEFFDIPNEEYVFSIVQVSRGHRKTDLYDEKEYPAAYLLPNGNTVCLPYLAALIRLADELDIAADRNLQFIYNPDEISNAYSKMEFLKHKAIRHVITNPNYFEMQVYTEDEQVLDGVSILKDKLEKTLDYCCEVVEKRTTYKISQKSINLVRLNEE